MNNHTAYTGRRDPIYCPANQMKLTKATTEGEELYYVPPARTTANEIGLETLDNQQPKAEAEDAAHASEDDAEQLARMFHETYERLAPNFGYETRKETREFQPNTPNGKLMIAVCRELLSEPWRRKTKGGAARASEVEEQAWHDGTMSPEIRATINRSK